MGYDRSGTGTTPANFSFYQHYARDLECSITVFINVHPRRTLRTMKPIHSLMITTRPFLSRPPLPRLRTTNSPSSEAQAYSSAENKTEWSLASEDHTIPPTEGHATSTSAKQTSPSAKAQTGPSPEPHQTSSKLPANSPEASGPVNDMCKRRGHNGKYYEHRHSHRHSNG